MTVELKGRIASIPPDVEMEEIPQALADDWYVTEKIKELHSRGITGRGVRCCIGDTGGTNDHPSLKKPFRMIDNTGSRNGPRDVNGHGTACSYIFMAIAPDAEYMTIKVLSDSGSGQMNWINRAYRQAGENGCHVYNGSYGDNGGPDIPSDVAALNAGYAAGLDLINIAAGNAGFSGRGSTVGRPATYDSTGATGATDRNNRISTFSSGGPEVDWATHGQDMTYARPGGGFGRGSGTSFSCPKFCGIVALVIQVRRMLGFRDLIGRREWREFFIDNDMLSDLGAPGEDDRYGIGIPDGEKIIDWMLKMTIQFV